MLLLLLLRLLQLLLHLRVLIIRVSLASTHLLNVSDPVHRRQTLHARHAAKPLLELLHLGLLGLESGLLVGQRQIGLARARMESCVLVLAIRVISKRPCRVRD